MPEPTPSRARSGAALPVELPLRAGGSVDLSIPFLAPPRGEQILKSRSKRLASKQKGRFRPVVFRAQDLLCRKHKLVKIAVKAARSSSSLVRTTPQTQPAVRAPALRAPSLASSSALVSAPVRLEEEGAEISSARRDRTTPLSPGEIRYIQVACGIVGGGEASGRQLGPLGPAPGGP